MTDAERLAANALLLGLARAELERRVRAAVDADRALKRVEPRPSFIRRLNDAEAAERVCRHALALVHEIGLANRSCAT